MVSETQLQRGGDHVLEEAAVAEAAASLAGRMSSWVIRRGFIILIATLTSRGRMAVSKVTIHRSERSWRDERRGRPQKGIKGGVARGKSRMFFRGAQSRKTENRSVPLFPCRFDKFGCHCCQATPFEV